jgi:ribosome biogenesis GTPase
MVGRLEVMHSGEADAIWSDLSGHEQSGRLRLARTLGVTPVAGDWVVVKGERVTRVLPRRNELRRTQTHGRPAQVLAANIDVVLIVIPLRSELHHRMIEGLTRMAKDANATPVLVVTKVDETSDLADFETLRRHCADLVGIVDVYPTSAATGAGVGAIGALLTTGTTAVLLGASGAGKTSLLNSLEGRSELTRTLSRTGEGRHATTTRKLYRLSSGGVLLDIPGIRFSRAVVDAHRAEPDFDDLDELASRCRFSNCGHGADLGCAIQVAIAAGEQDSDRVALWRTFRQ